MQKVVPWLFLEGDEGAQARSSFPAKANHVVVGRVQLLAAELSSTYAALASSDWTASCSPLLTGGPGDTRFLSVPGIDAAHEEQAMGRSEGHATD